MYSSDTLTKREAVILKICPPAIITSAEVIIAEYDAILGQWERKDFYNHLSDYTKEILLVRSRLRWLGHMSRMEDNRPVKSLLYGELTEGTRPVGRPKLRY